MPPRSSAPRSSKPASKAAAKPASSAKPASTKTAPVAADKPVSTKATAPVSRKGRATAAPAVAPVEPTIAEHGDDVMANGTDEKKTKINGTAPAPAPVPAANGLTKGKRGRLDELTSEAKESKKPRRSSLASVQSVRGTPMSLPIPQAPAPADPHNALFIFGTGDMGQFGLGPDELDEIKRPKLHSWFEEQIEDGKLSRDGKAGSGGLEAVAAGGMHNLVVDEAGKVWSWGINDNASLGRITSDVPDPENPGSVIDNEKLESVPHVVGELEAAGFRAVSVDAGDSVSVAVSDKGELRAWGSFRGNEGVLGFDGVPGHNPLQYKPMALPALEKAKVKIVQVACGSNHVVALTSAGHVYSWGSGQQNQTGRRIMERRQLNGLEPTRLGLRNIVHIGAGSYHSFAVDSNGVVWAWGLNTFHQTGLNSARGGSQEMVIVPGQVDALHPDEHNGAKVVQISGGEHHSLFLFDNGEVWGCGRSDAHQLGISKDHPAMEGVKERTQEVKQERLDKVEAAKERLEKYLKKGHVDDDFKAELQNAITMAELDINTPQDEHVPEPVRIAFPPIPQSYEVVPDFPSWADSKSDANPIAHISAGTRHNVAVSKSGHVYTWGLGQLCELGLGDEDEAEVPTLVRSKQLRPYNAVAGSAGGQHCCLLARSRE